MEARVGYLLKKFPRLSETFVLNEILAQEELGVGVHVFARRPADEEPLHPQWQRLRAEVEVLPSRRERDPWREIFGDDGPDVELVERLGACLAGLRPFGHPRLADLVSEALHLRQRCRALGLAHLHVHFATDAAVTALILRGIGGPTYSLTAHAKDIYRASVDPRLLARLLEASEFTVTVCEANRRHLAAELPARAVRRVRVLYNGIDLGGFAPPPRPERNGARILGVGRLVEKKGFGVLVDACGLLAGQGVDFRAVIAGEGEERAALQRRIADLGIGDRVQLVGAVDAEAVRALMAESSVFCLPCQVGVDGNRDALPTVLLEALAMGLPVVSTPVGGVPEILDDGRAGLLVPPGSPGETAQALRRLLESAELRERLARAGRAHAEEHFDLRKAARSLNRWFRETLEPLHC